MAETELHCSRDRLFPKAAAGNACAVCALCAGTQLAGCLCLSEAREAEIRGVAIPCRILIALWLSVGGHRAGPHITTLGAGVEAICCCADTARPVARSALGLF